MPKLGNVVLVNPGEAFRVIQRGRPGYRESLLVNLDPALASTWTVTNKTLDRSIDANGAIAVIGDGIGSLVDDLLVLMPGLLGRAGSATAASRVQPLEFSIEPGESLVIAQRAGPSSREVVLFDINSGNAQAWSTTNVTVNRAVNCNDAVAGLGDNVANLVDDLKLFFPGLLDHAGTNPARAKAHKHYVGSGGSFRVTYKGDNATRSAHLLDADADLGNAWTTSNVTTSRVVDANGNIAAVADNFCSLVEDLKVFMPGLLNKA